MVRAWLQTFKLQGLVHNLPCSISTCKLDGVGPADNRPSTNQLHHFVPPPKKKIHMTCDTWHTTRDMWHMVEGEKTVKTSAPQLLWFGIDSVL